MDIVVTLIAQKTPLATALVEHMAVILAAREVHWLAPGRACDIIIAGSQSSVASKMASILATDHWRLETADIIIQPLATRRKKLLISDMDSTMITVECIDELADFVSKKPEVAAITERAMNGELDFASALRARVALLKGLSESVLQQCYDERVKMMPGAKQLVQSMRNYGAHCVLVSGGFTFFTSHVAVELGFHEHYANTLIVANGKLTGEVAMPILGKEAKLQTLQDTCKKLGISGDDVLAVGDGANDLPMLLAAGLGVAYHAKPTVRAQAKTQINHCDLSALLFVQGI